MFCVRLLSFVTIVSMIYATDESSQSKGSKSGRSGRDSGTRGGTRGGQGGQKESMDEDSLALKRVTLDFFDAFGIWVSSDGINSTNFFDSGVYFSDDIFYCDPVIDCFQSVEEIAQSLVQFQPLINDFKFINPKFLGIHPSLPLRPVIATYDEQITINNGCVLTIPKVVFVLYFDQNNLITQYHTIDTINDASDQFFELAQLDSCD